MERIIFLDIYLIISFIGIDKFDPLWVSIRCLKIIFLLLKFVERFCCENEILIRYVMVVHSECGGWLKFISDCSRYRFTMLSWLCKKRLIMMVVLSSNRFQFRFSSWLVFSLIITLNIYRSSNVLFESSFLSSCS